MKKSTVLFVLAVFAAGIIIGGCGVYLLIRRDAPQATEPMGVYNQAQETQGILQQPGPAHAFSLPATEFKTEPEASIVTTTTQTTSRIAATTTHMPTATSIPTSVTTAATAVMQNISMEQAVALALKAAGLAESDVVFKKVVRSGDTPKYEVVFFFDGRLYSYDIRRSDGVITSNNEAPAEDSDIKWFSEGTILPLAKAREVALKDAKLDVAEFTRIRLEKDDGTLYYKLEFRTARMEYKYEIHAATGVVLDRDSDERD